MTTETATTLYKKLSSISNIDKKALNKAFELSKGSNESFEDILIRQDVIKDKDLSVILSDIYNVSFVDFSSTTIEKESVNLIPEEFAYKNLVAVFNISQGVAKVAVNDPKDKDIISNLAKYLGLEVKVFYSTKLNLQKAFGYYAKDLEESYKQIFEKGSLTKENIEKTPVKDVVDTLINYAYKNKASDVHIEPEDNESIVRFRVDGILHDVLKLDLSIHSQIVNRIKLISKLKTDEHTQAQDGRITTTAGGKDLDIRVSVVPVTDGEKIVMRLLSSFDRQLSLEDLGLSSEKLKILKEQIKKTTGMILVTGPTGSGKTTTIYSLLKLVNSREINIATIEDPVEYDMDGVNQIQVNKNTNLTFSKGLKAILRQDPDVIFVGEVRDEETAKISINSAMTGHLVLTTLHTIDSASSLPRMLDLGVEPFQVSSTINCVLAQRLVRQICDNCKKSKEVKKDELLQYVSEDVVNKYFGTEETLRVYEGGGCSVCNKSGYKGRVGIFEVLVVNEKINDLVTKKSNSGEIKQMAIKQGMETMFEDGINKVSKGETTISEVLRVLNE